MRKTGLTLLVSLFAVLLLAGLSACAGRGEPSDGSATGSPEDPPSGPPTDAPTATPTGAPTAVPTEAPTEAPTEPPLLPDLRMERLDDLMRPLLWDRADPTVRRETVLFLDKGDAKTLLYAPDRVLSVTSYDGSRTYEEGRDYELRDGKLYLPETSAIPCITAARYYGAGEDSFLRTSHNGRPTPTYWGEGRAMTDWQVCVTYVRSGQWEGEAPASCADRFRTFLGKLKAGEDVTVIFYGDSITYGASSSFSYAYEPYQPSYPMLFARALADLFEYRVRYVGSDPQTTCRVPSEDYVAGDRGTLTYINPSVGGWTAQDGDVRFDAYVGEQIRTHGCDLFVTAFGMNNAADSPRSVARRVRSIIGRARAAAPETSVLIVSTMVPNPTAVNGWYGTQDKQEPALVSLADSLYSEGTPAAVAPMTSVSLDVLRRKDFMDYTGNNINHPNDFFSRVYAQTLLQTLIGYGHIQP